jgi:hypothetical protein
MDLLPDVYIIMGALIPVFFTVLGILTYYMNKR